ncbi:hypothetical protein WS68_17795 [Burkholderia sp. TSV86]|nr:hypothetical protein WS68_17795 [Burkholderia sp. TSV86]
MTIDVRAQRLTRLAKVRFDHQRIGVFFVAAHQVSPTATKCRPGIGGRIFGFFTAIWRHGFICPFLASLISALQHRS